MNDIEAIRGLVEAASRVSSFLDHTSLDTSKLPVGMDSALRMLRSKKDAALEAMIEQMSEREVQYHPATHVLIEGLKNLPGGQVVLSEWDRARAPFDQERTKSEVVIRSTTAGCTNAGDAKAPI